MDEGRDGERGEGEGEGTQAASCQVALRWQQTSTFVYRKLSPIEWSSMGHPKKKKKKLKEKKEKLCPVKRYQNLCKLHTIIAIIC